jgi:hypothetical protein
MSFGLRVLAFAAALIASAGVAAADISRTVAQILDQFGWDTEDMGAVEAVPAIEPLCKLWCIPGIGKERLVAAHVQAAALVQAWG